MLGIASRVIPIWKERIAEQLLELARVIVERFGQQTTRHQRRPNDYHDDAHCPSFPDAPGSGKRYFFAGFFVAFESFTSAGLARASSFFFKSSKSLRKSRFSLCNARTSPRMEPSSTEG